MNLTILIVEDELPIRKNIVQRIRALSENYLVVAQASDGEEALSAIRTHPPDLLITDIQMPKMTGLDLIARVRERRPNLPIVIISSYDNFSYARTAIQYDVSEYLLKPFTDEQLAHVLSRAYEKKALQTIRDSQNLLQCAIKGLPADSPNILDFHLFYMTLLQVGNLHVSSHPPPRPSGRAEIQKLNSGAFLDFCGEACARPFFLLEENLSNRKLLLLPALPGERRPDDTRLHRSLQGFFKPCPVSLFVSEKAVETEALTFLASELAYLADTATVPCVSGRYALSASGNARPDLHESLLVMRYARLLNTREFAQFQSEFLSYFSERKWVPQRDLEHLTLRILLTVELEDKAPTNHLLERIQEICAYSEYHYSMLEELCAWIVVQFSAEKVTANENIITKVFTYIKNNYNKQISIEEISELFNFNTSYLIKLFRKRLGVTPMQYVIHLRIEEAKRLMFEKHDLSFKQISELCGYDDAHYFSRLFKKETGRNPSDYRDKLFVQNKDSSQKND